MFFGACDEYLYKSVFGHVRGIFVDIGAYNGVRDNETLFFESSCRWMGVCIEPNTDVFQQLAMTRKSLCVPLAISNGTTERLQILIPSGEIANLAGEAMKLGTNVLEIIRDYSVATGAKCELGNIPCVTLKKICDQYGISCIDYLSVDTVGSDIDILQTIGNIQVNMIHVNTKYRDPTQVLNDLKYVKIYTNGTHELWQHPDPKYSWLVW